MKAFLLAALLLFTGTVAPAQVRNFSFSLNDPLLSGAESKALQATLPEAGFDFTGKKVGYAELYEDPAGNVRYLEQTKSAFFTGFHGQQGARVHVLSGRLQDTAGYDAIIVYGDNKYRKALGRMTADQLVKDIRYRYPAIPEAAGRDNSPVLSAANAAFLTEIYRYSADAGTDFRGKKVAVVGWDSNGYSRLSMADYVQTKRLELSRQNYVTPDAVIVLTTTQKAETGGFDIIICEKGKKSRSVRMLVGLVKRGA